jgi:group I intron endonuclease
MDDGVDGFIYLIRNVVNGKGYVGKTIKSVVARFRAHKSAAICGESFALYRAMRKYGLESFSVYEVLRCDSSLLNDLERFYICFYGTRTVGGHGYNETDGGDGISGWTHSEEAKAKVSVANKGRIHSAETRAKVSAAGIGRKMPPRSAEWRAKQSASHRGQIPSFKGKHHSAETKVKLAALSKGKKLSAEAKAKLSVAFKGKKQSAEHVSKRMAWRTKWPAKK